MAETSLTQSEADLLISLEKHRVNDELHALPIVGQSLSLPLQSPDEREQFLLDVGRGRIDLAKVRMQNRARKVVVLVRLDLSGAPHRNPDEEEIDCPHLHRYREGYGDKWAYPIPAGLFPRIEDIWGTLDDFMKYVHITQPPRFEQELFV